MLALYIAIVSFRLVSVAKYVLLGWVTYEGLKLSLLQPFTVMGM